MATLAVASNNAIPTRVQKTSRLQCVKLVPINTRLILLLSIVHILFDINMRS